MTTEKKGDAPWEPRHQAILTRTLIAHLLSSRPQFLHLPGLAGEVDGHGGNRVSQKVIEVCKRMAVAEGLDKGVMQEMVSKGRKRKGGDEEGEGEGEGATASASERGGSTSGSSGGKQDGKRVRRVAPSGREKVKKEK